MTRKSAFFGLVLALASTGVCQAAFTIPNATVLGTDAPTTTFGGAGSTVGFSFTLGSAALATDAVIAFGSGTIIIDPSSYRTNGAGVMTAPASGGAFGGVPGTVNPGGGLSSPPGLPPGGFPIGAILIGNATLGWRPLFPANAANGLGSSSPTLNVSVNTTVGALFGGALAAGTVLQLVTNDANNQYFNNGGSVSVTSVPEPSSMVLAGLGGVFALAYARRRRAA